MFTSLQNEIKVASKDAVSALIFSPKENTQVAHSFFLALPKRHSHLTSAAHENAKVRLIRKASALVIAFGSNCHRFSVITNM